MLIIAFLVFIGLGNIKRVYCMKITSIEALHKSNHFVLSNNIMTYQHRTPNIINSKTPNFFFNSSKSKASALSYKMQIFIFAAILKL